MTDWTPELEKFIQNFADAEDKQIQSTINAKSTAGSLVRFVFNGRAMVSAYDKVCAEAGLEASKNNKGWNENIQKMIELAQQNGSSAADKIKKVDDFFHATYKPFAEKHPEIKNPDSLRGAYKLIKAAKKEKLQY